MVVVELNHFIFQPISSKYHQLVAVIRHLLSTRWISWESCSLNDSMFPLHFQNVPTASASPKFLFHAVGMVLWASIICPGCSSLWIEESQSFWWSFGVLWLCKGLFLVPYQELLLSKAHGIETHSAITIVLQHNQNGTICLVCSPIILPLKFSPLIF